MEKPWAKIIQIIHEPNNDSQVILTALCENSTIWELRYDNINHKRVWRQIVMEDKSPAEFADDH